MILNRIPAYVGLSFLICITATKLKASDTAIPDRVTLNVDIGNWQPHSLNDEPKFNTFGAAGATPFTGIGFCFPLGRDLGIRLTIGYWSLHDLNEVETVHTLIIHPLLLDLKYWLIPDNRLSVYVLYGAGLYLGAENETLPFGESLHQARKGWGLNLGAGFEWAFAGRLGFGLTFQYHYSVFKKPLGGVEDFSGPKINGSLLFYLSD